MKELAEKWAHTHTHTERDTYTHTHTHTENVHLSRGLDSIQTGGRTMRMNSEGKGVREDKENIKENK